ncbi:MAG: hypothetical protein V3V52_09070 [Candidatus Adiutricales bacterium]
MKDTNQLLAYRETEPGSLACSLDLFRLFKTVKERDQFESKWLEFLGSDPYNRYLFQLQGNRLTYNTEQLIPLKTNNNTPLLMVFGNPASRSVVEGMFFAFERDRKEHRFWKRILERSGVVDFYIDGNLSVEKKNEQRKERILNLKYNSPFRIGMSVFISMPSGASGPWSGVGGVQKLIGAKAMKRLGDAEKDRILETSNNFLNDKGVVLTFQKNAWEILRSDEDPAYEITLAKSGRLKGSLGDRPGIKLFGLPPTRLVGPCSRVMHKTLSEEGFLHA